MGNIHLNISCGSLKWIIFVESVLTQIERGEVNCMLMFSLFLLFASFMIISGAHVQSWLVGFSYLITHSFYGLLWKLFLQTYPEYTTLAMKQLKKLWVSFIRRFLLPSLLVIRQRDLLKCCISNYRYHLYRVHPVSWINPLFTGGGDPFWFLKGYLVLYHLCSCSFYDFDRIETRNSWFYINLASSYYKSVYLSDSMFMIQSTIWSPT